MVLLAVLVLISVFALVIVGWEPQDTLLLVALDVVVDVI